MKVNKLRNRILFLSPTVQAGWENQSHRIDFDFIEKLGAGSFGTVHKVKHKKNGKIYALKQIKKNSLDSHKLVQQARTQVKIMYSLNNPHIIKLYNHFEDEISIYLVLEYASEGQLYHKLKSTIDRKFPEEVAASFIYQVGLGLKEIHRNKILHRDIKPENILIGSDNKMKIADFGWSHFEEGDKRTTFCGTLDYLAPQMLEKGHEHDYRVDIWSIGVLIYELCTGDSPFSAQLIKNKTITEDLVKNNIKYVVYKFPSYLSKEVIDLISKILVANPNKRPTIQQILNHTWVRRHQGKQQLFQWQQSFRREMNELFPQLVESSENFFSKEEIYNFSRPESIINSKAKKKFQVHQQKPNESVKSVVKSEIGTFSQLKKLTELEMKVTELEIRHRRDQEEIQRLKEENQKLRSHDHCNIKINTLTAQLNNKNKTLEYLNKKLTESELARLQTNRS